MAYYGSTPPSKRGQLWLLIAIFILAFGLRFACLNQMKASPFFQNLIPDLDPSLYDAWAARISEGEWLGRGVFPAMPLYPYFLATIYSLFGRSLFVARLVQTLLGSLSCVLVYLIGRRVFNRWVGLIASLGASTYGVFLFYECTLVPVSLAIFVSLLTVLSALRARENPSPRRWLLTGLLAGLSSLARAAFLLFLFFLLVWVLIEYRRRRGIVYGLSILLGVLLTVVPVTVRNHVLGQDLVLIACQGGVNFYIGNNPEATGTFNWRTATSPNSRALIEDSRRIAEERMGRPLKPSEVDAFWFGQGLQFIGKQPLKALALFGKKLAIFFNSYEIPDVSSYYFAKRYASILRLPLLTFAVLAPLALTGMVVSVRIWRRALPLHIFAASYTLAVVGWFVHSRYRLPVVPILLLFAAYVLYWWFERVRRREYRTLLLSLLPLAIFSLGVNVRIIDSRRFEAFDHNNLGLAYSNLGDHDKAFEEFRRGVKIDPRNPAIRVNLAVSHVREGRYDEAIEEAERALEMDPGLWNGYAVMALAYELKGKGEEAAEQWRKVLELDPDNQLARRRLEEVEKTGR